MSAELCIADQRDVEKTRRVQDSNWPYKTQTVQQCSLIDFLFIYFLCFGGVLSHVIVSDKGAACSFNKRMFFTYLL